MKALERTTEWVAEARRAARALAPLVAADLHDLWAALLAPHPRPLLLGIAAGALTWPLAAPAALAALLGGLPPALPLFALTLAIWAAGWTVLAHLARGEAPPASAGPLLRSAGPAAAIGAAVAAAWALSAWWASAVSGAAWSAVLGAALAWFDAALVLVLGVIALRAPLAALPAALRRLPAPALALQAAAAAAAWYLLRGYLHIFLPQPLLTPWLAWPALAAAAFACLKTSLWLAHRAAPEPPPAGAPSWRPLAAGAAFLAAAVLLGLARAPLAASLAAAPAGRALGRANRLIAGGDYATALAPARRAAAAAAGLYALATARRGAGAAAATAAITMDPQSANAQLALGLLALGSGQRSVTLAAARALDAAGAPGRGAYLAALACGGTHPLRGCRATAAAAALWADPRLAWFAPTASGLPGAAELGARLLNRAVGDWAAAVAGPAQVLQWPNAARADAQGQLLTAYTAGLTGLTPQTRAQIAVAAALTAAAVGDGNGVQAALAGLDTAQGLSAATAESVLLAGSIYGTVAPDITAGAVGSPLPAAVSAAALGAARAADAPPELLLRAGEYAILSANRGQGTSVSGEQTAIGLLQRYSARRPRDPRGFSDLALAHYELAQYPEALQAAGRALALRPEDQLAEAVAGDSLFGEAEAAGTAATMRTADLTAAAAHLRAALAINPAPFLVWMALGDVLDLQHQPAQALSAYRQAQHWLTYDLAQHVETFSAPHEGWGVTGLPAAGGGGPGALQARIQKVQQEVTSGAA